MSLAVAWHANPGKFSGHEAFTPERPAEDMAWEIPPIGVFALRVHPKWILTELDHTLIVLWSAYRDHGVLPFAGGLAEQPAMIVGAFAQMDRAVAALKSIKWFGQE